MLDWLKLVPTLPFKPISVTSLLCSGCSARPVVSPPGPLVTLHTGASLNLSCALDCLLSAATISYDWVQTLATGETLVLANRPDLWLEDLGFEHSGQFQCYVRCDKSEIMESDIGQCVSDYFRINHGSLMSDTVTVSVVGPPYIDTEDEMENITANVGDDLDIEVYFCSRPLASASWIVR